MNYKGTTINVLKLKFRESKASSYTILHETYATKEKVKSLINTEEIKWREQRWNNNVIKAKQWAHTRGKW